MHNNVNTKEKANSIILHGHNCFSHIRGELCENSCGQNDWND